MTNEINEMHCKNVIKKLSHQKQEIFNVKCNKTSRTQVYHVVLIVCNTDEI